MLDFIVFSVVVSSVLCFVLVVQEATKNHITIYSSLHMTYTDRNVVLGYSSLL